MAVGRDLCEIGNMIDSMNLIYVDIFLCKSLYGLKNNRRLFIFAKKIIL